MRIEHKNFALAGIIFTALSIVLGAFGAHALEALLSAEKLANFEVGVRYQVYQGLALMWLSLVSSLDKKALKQVYYLWLIGVIFFSGSLYVLAFTEVWDFTLGPLVFITPLGGTLLIFGWLRLLVALWRKS
jgi:uncharacterized membrane protein YgdD (TMEM256/DUF423 family)